MLKAALLENAERRGVVVGGAGVEGPMGDFGEEESEGGGGDAAVPIGSVDPVCDFGIALEHELRDVAGDVVIEEDRSVDDVGIGQELAPVGVEGGPVGGVLRGEGGHVERDRILLVLKEVGEVALEDGAEADCCRGHGREDSGGRAQAA